MSTSIQSEEYEVYRVVLLSKFKHERRERFVIRDTLTAWSLRLPFRHDETIRSKVLQWRLKLKGLKASAADDLIAKNRDISQLDQKLDLPLPCVLLTEAESNTIWRLPDGRSSRGQPLDGWKVFRERYPGACGVISFSRVGFDELRQQALVEFGIQADSLMGHGGMVLLSRVASEWEITGELHLWIS